MLEYLLLIPALLLLFFLPGYTLLQALFPSVGEMDDEDDLLFRLFMGATLSVIISGGIFSLLALRPGKPLTTFNMAGLLLLFSLFFFYVGYRRGAYPFLGGPEAPMVIGPALPKEDAVLAAELGKKLRVTERDLAIANKRVDGAPSVKLRERIKLLEVERDLVSRELEILEKPEELRVLHERAQVLVRRWGRLTRAAANSRPSPRKDRLEAKRAEVEQEINELHTAIRTAEAGGQPPAF